MPSVERIVKAKKNHKCTECACDIKAGTPYLHVKLAWFKNHSDCSALQKFKNTWIGKRVKIIGINHPHRGESGTCAAVEYTHAGWGIRIQLENGEGCFVFRGTDIRLDPIFE